MRVCSRECYRARELCWGRKVKREVEEKSTGRGKVQDEAFPLCVLIRQPDVYAKGVANSVNFASDDARSRETYNDRSTTYTHKARNQTRFVYSTRRIQRGTSHGYWRWLMVTVAAWRCSWSEMAVELLGMVGTFRHE